MKIIIHWLILSLAIYAATYFVDGITISGPLVALIAGACLGFINVVVKPIISLITLPINILTLGIFSIILNGLLFWALTKVVPGFGIATFKAAVIGSIAVAVINWLGVKILKLD